MKGGNIKLVYEYDNSIVQDLRCITANSKKTVYITPPSEYFDLISSLKQDDIKLPLISLSRPSWNLLGTKPQAMIFEGVTIQDDRENDLVRNLQAIPIVINYQLDVWTNNRLENDLITREVIWNYTLNPTLTVNIPYKDIDYKHTFNLFLNNEIEDNSDIIEHKNLGRLFRQTISLYTDDAYLWKIKDRRHTKFHVDVGINDSLNNEERMEHVYADCEEQNQCSNRNQ